MCDDYVKRTGYLTRFFEKHLFFLASIRAFRLIRGDVKNIENDRKKICDRDHKIEDFFYGT